MSDFLLELDTAPMEAKSVNALPSGEQWQFEPKWDGFRCLIFKTGQAVDLRAKSGKSLSRYFPEMIEAIRATNFRDFVLDAELTVPRGDTLSFGALQDRIHPAESRIRRLSIETPALLVCFDCLATAQDGSLLQQPLQKRRQVLENLMRGVAQTSRTCLSPTTRDADLATNWLNDTNGALDGVMAKRTDGIYTSGERTMLKVKRLRSADCVIGGFRYAKGSDEVGSLLLGLYNAAGQLDHVGFTSAISRTERTPLTARLQALIGAPGFTGNAPGGPSRWSNDPSSDWCPLKPELVVEVTYDQVTDGRFRHGTMLHRWRPDKSPRQCTREQLQQELQPAHLFGELLNLSARAATHNIDQQP